MTFKSKKEIRETSYLGNRIIVTIYYEENRADQFHVEAQYDLKDGNVADRLEVWGVRKYDFRFGEKGALEINWSALGNTDTRKARFYNHMIDLAIEVADELNED